MEHTGDFRWKLTAIALGAFAALLTIRHIPVILVAMPLVVLGWYCLSGPRRWLYLFFGTALLLPPVAAPIGNAGIHPCLAVAALGLLCCAARARDWQIGFTKLNAALTALLLVLSVSVAMAAVYSGAAVAAGSAARVLLFAIAVFVYFTASQGPDRGSDSDQRRMTRVLFWIAVAAAAFGCIDFYYQLPAPAGFGAQFIWLESGVYRRAQGFFYEASTLGNFCAFFLVMAAVSLSSPRSDRPVKVLTLGVGTVVLIAALVLSYSRTSVLNVVISVGVLAILEWRRWVRPRTLAAVAVSAACAGAILMTFLREFAFGYIARFQHAADYLGDSPDQVFSGRLESWSTIVSFLGDQPWHLLSGIGYKTLPYTEYLGKPLIADNMYLSLLVETGLAGLLALIALNIAILAVCWKAMRDPRRAFYAKWMFCFWIGESVQMLSGDILTYWRVLPVYFWVLAAVVGRSNQESADLTA